MRSQAERDQQIITIATSLAIFIGTLATGGLFGLLLNAVGDMSERATAALTIGTLTLAGLLALAYVARHRRP